MEIDEHQIKLLADRIKKGKLQETRDPVAFNLLHKYGIDLKKEKAKSIRSAKAKARYHFSRLKGINENRKKEAEKRSEVPPSSIRSTGFRNIEPIKKNYGGFLTRSEINTLKFEPSNYTPPKQRKYYY